MSELAIVNMNLPARVWLPIYDFPHYVVRIPYRSAAVLNSKEKAPYIVYIEVIECENVFTTPLVPKLLDNNLQAVKSQENLLNGVVGGGGGGMTNVTGAEGGGGGETTSQVNFTVQESSSTQQLQQQQQSAAADANSIKTNPAESAAPTNANPVPGPSKDLSMFDPNNCDRWSISSDMGPINSYSNGNFRVLVCFVLFRSSYFLWLMSIEIESQVTRPTFTCSRRTTCQ